MAQRLFTPYSEQLSKQTIPHDYYPRMQLKRDSFINLNGEWDFTISKLEKVSEFDSKILVPFPPESQLSGIEKIIMPDEYMHYRRTFAFNDSSRNDNIYLHFGAIDQIADIFLNGTLIGKCNSPYIPFSVEISNYLIDGDNELYVVCKDGIDKTYPYGKQTYKRGGMWYTPVSGIWQTVWLEAVPKNHITNLKITPSLNSAEIEVTGGEYKKKITLLDSDEVFTFEGEKIVISPKNIINWTPENPHLYHFKIESGKDTVYSYFALRTVGKTMRAGKELLTLNDEPYLFQGLLDQGYYSDGIFLPATVDGYRDDILRMKELGFNMLRKHIKIEPLIFYYLCDSLGMLVCQDLVNNSDYSFIRDTVIPTVSIQTLPDEHLHNNAKERAVFIEMLSKTTTLLYNSPSIVYYTIFNEGWGQFCADKMYDLFKQLDSTRIIDSTSGWFRRKKSDVDSRHIYFKALKAKKLNGKAFVISEFGGYSHRISGHLFSDKEYGYKSYDNLEDYQKAVAELYDLQVREMIKCGCSGFVYTQVSDVEDETNGILTYDRRVCKLNVEKFKPILDSLYAEFKKWQIEFLRH